jgi:hypothetical protein
MLQRLELQTKEDSMSKGQQGNKEVKKPKQAKQPPPKPAGPAGGAPFQNPSAQPRQKR